MNPLQVFVLFTNPIEVFEVERGCKHSLPRYLSADPVGPIVCRNYEHLDWIYALLCLDKKTKIPEERLLNTIAIKIHPGTK